MKKPIFRPLVWLLTAAMLLQTAPENEKPSSTAETVVTATSENAEEVTAERTENTKTFRLADGSYVSATYPQRVHYKADGEWKDIDNRFSDDSGLFDAAVENAENSFRIKFAKKAKNNKLATIKQGSTQLSWSLDDSNKTSVRVLGVQNTDSNPYALKKISGALVYENIVSCTICGTM